MQNNIPYNKHFHDKRNFVPNGRPTKWSYPKEQENIPIVKREYKENVSDYKKVLCNKKYSNYCFMGRDCTFRHIDEDPEEIAKNAEQQHLSYCRRRKKLKMEYDNFKNGTFGFNAVSNSAFGNNVPKNNKAKIEDVWPILKDDRLNFDPTKPIKKLNSQQVCLDESCYYSASSKSVDENKLENGFCHKLNNLAIGCNMYSNLIGNYVIRKNLSAIYLCSEILNNLDKIENNAIILRCLLNLFPAFKKLYLRNESPKIKFAAQNPIYAIEPDDSVETREEKLKIRHLDKLYYTNMVIAHQSSVINAIYKCNGSAIYIFTPLINYVSKHFIVDLYLQSYYPQYREPITDELCAKLFEENKHIEQNQPDINFPDDEFIKEELDTEYPMSMEQAEYVDYLSKTENANYNEGFSDEFKQYLRYYQQ